VISRTPEWLKKMFAAVTKSERNGPVFRFFMDLGDAGLIEPVRYLFLFSIWCRHSPRKHVNLMD